MKIVSAIAKMLAALATVVGAIYLLATYGEQIVAWCKKVMASLPEKTCCCGKCGAEAEAPAEEEAAEEAVVEEVAVEEVPVEEVPVEETPAEEPAENEVVADEADFVE